MGMYLTIASRNLRQAKRRTLLLAGALALVTMALVLMLSLAQGLTDTLIHSSTTLSAGHVNVAGFYKSTSSDAAPIITNTGELRKIVQENTPGLAYIVDRHRGWARIVSETSSLNAGLTGIDITEEKEFARTIILAKESEYKEGGRVEVLGDIQRLSEPNTVMIFAAQAKRLGVTVGDSLTVVIELLNGTRNTGEAQIVAIAKDIGMMSNWSMFFSKQTILDLYQLQPGTSGAVMVYLNDIEQSEKAMEHLRGVFEQKGYKLLEHDPNPFWMKFEKISAEDWLGQKLDLTLWRDEVSFAYQIIVMVQVLSIFLLSVLSLIILIGVVNNMSMSVRERTREIGTVRAIGMTRTGILLLFLTEAFLLGLFGTSIGGITGALIAAGIDAAQINVPVEAVQAILMSDKLHLMVPVPAVIGSIVVLTLFTALAALWPSFRAARLQPVQAIHST